MTSPPAALSLNLLANPRFLPLERRGSKAFYGGQEIRLGDASGNVRGDSVLMMRPERLRFVPAAEAAGGTGDNYFRGTVTAAIYQGECRLFEVALAGQDRIFVRVANRAENFDMMPAQGDQVTLRLQQSDTRLVSAEA